MTTPNRDPVTGRWLKDPTVDQRICRVCMSQRPDCRHKYEDGYICHRCWRITDQYLRRMTYKGKQMIIPKCYGLSKKSICTDCGKVGPTTWSHTEYDDAKPFSHMIERCASCHNKYDWGAGIYRNNSSKISQKLSKKPPSLVLTSLNSEQPHRRCWVYLLQTTNSKPRFMSLIS